MHPRSASLRGESTYRIVVDNRGAVRLVATTLPHGETHAFGWTPAGLPASYTAPEAPDAGRRLDRAYDAAREQTALVKPDGTVVSNLYDSAGRLAAVVAMRGGEEERVSLVYDPAGRLESVSAEGDETAYLQDEYALLVEIDVAYNGDVVRVGELSVNRNPATGFVGMLGVERDPTGLLFMRNRYYSPTLGRFLTRDPIGIAGGDVNWYCYCGNDPVNFVDPEGLYSEWCRRLCGLKFVIDTMAIGVGIPALIPALAPVAGPIALGLATASMVLNSAIQSQWGDGYSVPDFLFDAGWTLAGLSGVDPVFNKGFKKGVGLVVGSLGELNTGWGVNGQLRDVGLGVKW